MRDYLAQSTKVGIRRSTESDRDEFVKLAQISTSFHYPWVDPPKTPDRFDVYLRSRNTRTDDGFLICELATGRLAGVINLNCIVRGFFLSAYLGYYAFAPLARKGYMLQGLKLVTQYAFNSLGLHRLEANIQPANIASIELVKKCGFQKEGFSPKYLKVLGEWRDHERWAVRADEPTSGG